jgi:hypothetical protein
MTTIILTLKKLYIYSYVRIYILVGSRAGRNVVIKRKILNNAGNQTMVLELCGSGCTRAGPICLNCNQGNVSVS